MKKLASRKWAVKKDNAYSLATYQFVWSDLGVERSWNKTIAKYRFTYHKIDLAELPVERKEYFPELQKMILTKVASNLTQQIRWRLNNKQSTATVVKSETFLSARKVAKLFGLKSSRSGHEYRKRFFDVMDSDKKPQRNSSNKLVFECRKIAI